MNLRRILVVLAASTMLLSACGGSDPVPANLDAPTVEKHCAEMAKRYEEFAKTYSTPAAAFFQPLRPANLPTTVVYPFGGGDLASALVTYPDARDITTISLEPAADPRGIDGANATQLTRALRDIRAHLGKLFLKAHSRTDNLDLESSEVLQDALESFTGTVIAVSHDRAFLRSLGLFWHLDEWGVVREFPGIDLVMPVAPGTSVASADHHRWGS